MNCYAAFLVTLLLLQGFIVQGATATEAESLEPGVHSDLPTAWWYYPGASVEPWSAGTNPGVSYTGAVYPGMSGVYPNGYPTGSYPFYPSAGYPGGSYPVGGYPGFGGYPGTRGSYPGSGRSYPGSGRGIVPPTGTDNGKIPGGVPVSDDVEIFNVPGRGGYGR